jgi:large subunit ribosomal protein L25
METIKLEIEPRQGKGKGTAARLRRGGKVPAVFYGPRKPGAPICVNAREFRQKVDGLEGSHLIQFLSSLPELKDKLALLREVQRHPVNSMPLHIDFYEVDENKPLQTSVPLHFIGKAEGVTAGGVLQPLVREITVECLPREIPAFIEVDVSPLAIHQTIHIEELALPAGVQAIFDSNIALVMIAAAPVAAPTEEKPTEGEGAAAAPTDAAAPAETEKK